MQMLYTLFAQLSIMLFLPFKVAACSWQQERFYCFVYTTVQTSVHTMECAVLCAAIFYQWSLQHFLVFRQTIATYYLLSITLRCVFVLEFAKTELSVLHVEMLLWL